MVGERLLFITGSKALRWSKKAAIANMLGGALGIFSVVLMWYSGLRVFLFSFVPPVFAFLSTDLGTYQTVVFSGALFAMLGATLAWQRRYYIATIIITALSLCFGGNFFSLLALAFLAIGKKDFEEE